MLSELLDMNGRIPYSHLYCATGSGGTLAGLLLGREILQLEVEIVAVNVCNDRAYFEQQVGRIVEEFNRRQNSELKVDPKSYTILEGYVGPGYAAPYDEELQAIRRLARTEGVFLDPVYTGKAFYGLMDQAAGGRFTTKDHILFIHTGGLFGLFPQRRVLAGING
jgi:D-cysteine desulfhydrase